MAGNDLSKRDAILVFVTLAFLALGGLYWYYPYKNRQTMLDELDSRVERLETTNQRARADLARGGVAELQAEADEYGRMFEVLRQLVPNYNEVPDLLEQVSTASRREGLEFGQIKPNPIIPGPEFDTHSFSIGVVGGYHEIARFLTNIGSLTRIVTPVNVTLEDRLSMGNSPVRAARNSGLVQAQFEIRTYVARTSPMPAPVLPGGN